MQNLLDVLSSEEDGSFRGMSDLEQVRDVSVGDGEGGGVACQVIKGLVAYFKDLDFDFGVS